MKKAIQILLLLATILNFCACSDVDDDKPNAEKNYLDGYGEFHQKYGDNIGVSVFYDDEYIYIQNYDGLTAFGLKDGKCRPVCVDASCKHESINCKQNIQIKSYFVFNDNLYYSVRDKEIFDSKTGELVHTVTIPEELASAEDSDRYKPNAYIILPVNEEYLQINCLQYAYIVDKEFNIKYSYKRGESFHFALIQDDSLYYTSEFSIIKANMETKEEVVLNTEGKVVDVDINDKGIFYTNTYNELFRYDIDKQESHLIKDNVSFICCSDDYIYYIENNLNNNESQSKEIRTIDENGKDIYILKNPLNSYITSEMYIIGDKIYAYDIESGSLLISNLDGSEQTVTKRQN